MLSAFGNRSTVVWRLASGYNNYRLTNYLLSKTGSANVKATSIIMSSKGKIGKFSPCSRPHGPRGRVDV